MEREYTFTHIKGANTRVWTEDWERVQECSGGCYAHRCRQVDSFIVPFIPPQPLFLWHDQSTLSRKKYKACFCSSHDMQTRTRTRKHSTKYKAHIDAHEHTPTQGAQAQVHLEQQPHQGKQTPETPGALLRTPAHRAPHKTARTRGETHNMDRGRDILQESTAQHSSTHR